MNTQPDWRTTARSRNRVTMGMVILFACILTGSLVAVTAWRM